MPLCFGTDAVAFKQDCLVEEALPLLEFLQAHPGAPVNLFACTHLHSAVLQVLMALRPSIVALPGEAFLRRWLTPVFGPDAIVVPASPRAAL
ncbi:MAG: hypothetical protein P4M00_00195 [Azospirillaceae bacterium]|nr:hypothetical protein [Azospirillaceae bacterium]